MKRQILFAVVLAFATSGVFFGCQLSDAVRRILGISDKVGPKWIEIRVSAGTKPTFSWKGGPVTVICVDRIDDNNSRKTIWGARTPGEDGIYSPVVYGEMPPGAVDARIPYYVLPSGVEPPPVESPPIDSLYPPAVEKGRKYAVYVATVGAAAFGM